MLIKAYGQLWNPHIIDWGSRGAGNKGKLIGEVLRQKKWHDIDFWEARGIYVLHSDFRAIYVGQILSDALGKRIRDHFTDRFAGRWDMFSWFSVAAPRFSRNDVSAPGKRTVAAKTVVDSLEALSILIADPSLNRKRESLEGAFVAFQPKKANPKAVRAYLEEILKKL